MRLPAAPSTGAQVLVNRFARNILSNYAGYGVSIVVALLLTPFVVRTLGDDAYGLWSIVVSLTGYYGLMDLGIRSAVGQYLTRYWALEDLDGVNRTLNTALVLTGAAAAVLILVTVLLAWLAPHVFTLGGVPSSSLRVAFLIMGTAVALSLPIAVFGAATYARQRFDIANGIGILEKLVWAALCVVVLRAGGGLAAVAAVTGGTNVLAGLARVAVAFKLLPGLAVSRRWFRRDSVRELGHFGVHNFLVNAADQIVLRTDAILIGAILVPAAVTYYNLGANFIGHYLALINAVAWVLTPYATSCDARGDHEALRRLWLHGTRLIFLLAAVVGGGMIFLGRDFLSVWIDPKYVSGEEFTSSAIIMAVLSGAALVRGLMSCGKQVLFGMREVVFLARLSMAEAVLCLVTSLVLIHWLGILGVALGTLIPILSTQLWIQPRHLAAKLGVGLARFVRHVAPGGCAVLAVMGASSWLAGRWLEVDGWPAFFVKGALVAGPAVLLGLAVGTTTEEKRQALRRLGLARGS